MSEYSPVRVDIKNIAEAKSIIVDNAQYFWLNNIDWTKYELADVDTFPDIFDFGYLMALRNSIYQLPLSVLSQGKSENDDYYWNNIPESHYLELGGKFRLAQLKQTLTPIEATLLRDYLIVNLTESILQIKTTGNVWSSEKIIEDLFSSNPGFKQSCFNCYDNLYSSSTPFFPHRIE